MTRSLKWYFNLIPCVCIFTAICIFAAIGAAAQPSAKKIVASANELMRGESTFSEVSMSVVKPDWSRSFSMKIWALEPEFSLIYIISPARDKGTVTLKRQTEVWNWLPTVRKIIKIPPSMMMQSWMGSDFTNDDLVRESSILDDYTHTLVGEESYAGYECYLIEMIPKPEAAVVWGKLRMWISKKKFLQLKTEYYDEDAILVKAFFGSKVKYMDNREIPTHWEMIPSGKPGNKTILEYSSIKFNVKIEQNFFSQQNMKRVH